jgi:hypothetical protein
VEKQLADATTCNADISDGGSSIRSIMMDRQWIRVSEVVTYNIDPAGDEEQIPEYDGETLYE